MAKTKDRKLKKVHVPAHTKKVKGKKEEIPPSMELVRLAFPRRVYTQSHFDYAIEVIIKTFKERKKARGLKIIWEPPFLRHFSAKLKPVK